MEYIRLSQRGHILTHSKDATRYLCPSVALCYHDNFSTVFSAFPHEKIKAIGIVSWGICIASITIAVSCAVVAVSTAGTTAVPDALIATPAMATLASVLGLPTAISAVAIAVAGGGVGALNKLRNYRLERVSDEKIILHKK